jgi:hypothetical protein
MRVPFSLILGLLENTLAFVSFGHTTSHVGRVIVTFV